MIGTKHMAITINKLIGGDIIINTNTKPQLTELCFTAEEANSTVTLQKQGSAAIEGFNGLEYKLNDGNWNSYAIGSTIGLTNVGDKVYMRAVEGGNYRMAIDIDTCHYFDITGKIAASGNINTLLDPNPNAGVSLARKDYCYHGLFLGCRSLTQSPELPSTELADYCYENMFSHCTSLTQAPELPSTELADYCYSYMFTGCSSLTQAPTLPATTLANYCYFDMFTDCPNFSEVHMKSGMESVYDPDTHGDTTKTVVYDLA